MSKTQKDVESFLDYFLDDATKVDYAVLIDAPWGGGKTEFVRAYLKRRDNKIERRDPLQTNVLFVSLFGLSKPAEVRDALFAQAHPLFASGLAKFTGTLAVGLLDKHFGVKIDKDVVKASKAWKLSAKIIVFDDLERTAMPLGEALGVINTFVESGGGQGFKVIVIADESRIPDHQRPSYAAQKEKVIGRTLTVRPDAGAVLDLFIAALTSEVARTATTANRDLLVTMFDGSEHRNFRSLRHALADFSRLVSELDPRLSQSPPALQKLLNFVVAVGLEMRAQTLKPAIVADFQHDPYSYLLSSSEAEEHVRVRLILEKYPEVEWRDPIVPPAILADMIATGVLDADAANLHLVTHPAVVGANAVRSWRKLWDWSDLSTTDYQATKERFLADLEAGAFNHPSEILHAAGIAITLAKAGDAFIPDPVAFFRDYITKREEQGDLVPAIGQFQELGREGAASLAFQSADDDRFGEVWNSLQAAVERVHDLAMAEAAAEFLASLKSGKAVQHKLLAEADIEGGYGGDALLHHIAVKDFADVLLRGGRTDKLLLSTLSRRFKGASAYPDLLKEQEWLLALDRELQNRAAEAPPPQDYVLKRTLAHWFGPMKAYLAQAAHHDALRREEERRAAAGENEHGDEDPEPEA